MRKGLTVNIIQHQGGGPKRVALCNSLILSADYPLLQYCTDTIKGSSGSPVFDEWRVVGLHRGAASKTAELHGRMLAYVNEGIQIRAIRAALDGLSAIDPGVAAALDEIRGTQEPFAG